MKLTDVCKLLLLSIFPLLFACTDPCENLICQNGGTCLDGSCQCPARYSGTNCEIDLCANGVQDGNETGVDCGGDCPNSCSLTSNFTKYDINNSNLPDNNIGDLIIDGSGNIWVGTNEGVAMFDGTTWTQYNSSNTMLPSDEIRSVFESADGHIWVSCWNGGVGEFDGSTWTIHIAGAGTGDLKFVSAIDQDGSGNMWFAASDLLKKDANDVYTKWTPQNSDLPDAFLIDMELANDGTIWCATSSEGVFSLSGNTFTLYTSQNSDLIDNDVLTVNVESNNKIWFGTQSGLVLFENNNWTTYNMSNSILNGDVSNTLGLTADAIWVNALGVHVFDGTDWVFLTTTNSDLGAQYATHMVQDASGTIWMGTQQRGLYKFDINL